MILQVTTRIKALTFGENNGYHPDQRPSRQNSKFLSKQAYSTYSILLHVVCSLGEIFSPSKVSSQWNCDCCNWTINGRTNFAKGRCISFKIWGGCITYLQERSCSIFCLHMNPHVVNHIKWNHIKVFLFFVSGCDYNEWKQKKMHQILNIRRFSKSEKGMKPGYTCTAQQGHVITTLLFWSASMSTTTQSIWVTCHLKRPKVSWCVTLYSLPRSYELPPVNFQTTNRIYRSWSFYHSQRTNLILSILFD